MKQIFTLSLLLFSFSVVAQQKNAATKPNTAQATNVEPTPQANRPATDNPRAASTSMQTQASEPVKPSYDVNDKYMGRKEEFLANLTVKELPSDFPLYEKQWSLKEYNQVVVAFYYNHMSIVTEGVKAKLQQLKH